MKKLVILLLSWTTFIWAKPLFQDSFEAGVPVPDNIIITDVSETDMQVQWDEVKDADSYTFYYATTSFADFTGRLSDQNALAQFAEAHSGARRNPYRESVYLSDLTQGTRYFVIITATQGNRVSQPSIEKAFTTDILAPDMVKVRSFGMGSTEISWQANPDATSYTLYVSSQPFDLDTDYNLPDNGLSKRHPDQLSQFIKDANGKVYQNITATTFTLDKLTATEQYFYVITSSKGDVEGYASPQYNFTVLGAMNDTGVIKPELATSAKCEDITFGNQDCGYGRDKTDNDDVNGFAGFAYTKLDDEGNPLPADATEWSCVKDEVTGLIWEVKTRYSRIQTYTHYDPNYGGEFDLNDNRNDGGDDGIWSGKSGYSTTHGYVVQQNRNKLCGITDWRVPSRAELRGLVNYGQDEVNADGQIVFIDLDYFPHAQPNDYWTSNHVTDNPVSAWTVYFGNGTDNTRPKDTQRRVRLVHGNQ